MRFAATDRPPPITEAAIDTAHRMRVLLRSDLDEFELADRVCAMNDELNADTELMQAAWQVLNGGERRAWKQFLTLRKEHEREHHGY